VAKAGRTNIVSDPDGISAITREAVLCVLTARDAYHAFVLGCRTFGLALAAVASLLGLMLFHWAPLIAFASSFVGFAITHAHGYH
jgi:hypothetical protein